MNRALRYWLFQIPGILLLLLVLFLLYRFDWIDARVGFLSLFLWILKDLLLYPFLRKSYETGPASGRTFLVGMEGEVVRDLDPTGMVRVRGELWKAKHEREGERLVKGDRIWVRRVEGMVLEVATITGEREG